MILVSKFVAMENFIGSCKKTITLLTRIYRNMCNVSSAAGTENEIQESGAALASGVEEKLPLLF
ncbi:hypothetical protein C0J52_04579 [Blattella germanica]|nr:hypothetical protein C0J52_04579 [Blattella germanica]